MPAHRPRRLAHGRGQPKNRDTLPPTFPFFLLPEDSSFLFFLCLRSQFLSSPSRSLSRGTGNSSPSPNRGDPNPLPLPFPAAAAIPMKPTTRAATPRGSPPSSAATRRHREAALPLALGDVTNLLLPDTPTPIKPRRTSAASASASSSTASVTPATKPSSSATPSVTPAPKPSSASVLEAERSAVASPAISTLYATRSRATEARRTTRNPTGTNSKGKEPVAASAAGTSSFPHLGKSTSRKTTTAQDSQLISSSAVTPPPKPSSAAALEVEEERSLVASPSISTVYAKRRTPDAQGMRRNSTGANNRGRKLVAAAGTASCPLLGKATSRKTSMVQDTQPISSSAPCHEAKKKRPSRSTPKLPEDFVKKQRAYFADIDAFELEEEEVSKTDLE
ncbi:hypothetical protein PVAP13_9NG786300 [Panicum virgatum]|uniref:Sororin C-terminal region domain-containing protein n=2 Tax=Panicum virgatum TaxID=38727 RepID=A0A8T0N4C3_PANVG|nr:hypothetical protein PVAP13_9NG786300 [Panicum virgatum]